MAIQKKYHLIVDFETIDLKKRGDYYPRVAVNGGLLLVDNNFNEVLAESVIIKNTYNVPGKYIANSWYLPKVQKIEKRKTTTWVNSFKEFAQKVSNIVENYNVEIWSYNAKFDYNVFIRNAEYAGIRLDKSLKNYLNERWFCLWNYSVDLLLNRPSFKRFALNQMKKSDAWNYLSNAEVTYQYIKDKPNFQEEHTGLADCYVELEILKYCKRQRKKGDRSRSSIPWKKLNPKKIGTGFGHMAWEIENEKIPTGMNNKAFKILLNHERR